MFSLEFRWGASENELNTKNQMGEGAMATCDICGNHDEGAIRITLDGRTHAFDSFECIINVLVSAVHGGASQSTASSRDDAAPALRANARTARA